MEIAAEMIVRIFIPFTDNCLPPGFYETRYSTMAIPVMNAGATG